MTLSGHSVSKRYGSPEDGLLALDEVTFEIHEHEFVCLVGPSGCGKTTLLKILAGLIEPTTGRVQHDRPGGRSAVVFQEHGLFPWLTVLDNVAFGLEAAGVPRGERYETARTYTKLVGLDGFEDSYPRQLSGGMKQRVGIARALAVDPDLLLMDEPFGSLDYQTKRVMQTELLRVWRADRKQVVYVTHDVEEAVHLADRVLVMTARPGRILADVPIHIERPRDASADTYQEAAEHRWQIWQMLEDEVLTHLEGDSHAGADQPG